MGSPILRDTGLGVAYNTCINSYIYIVVVMSEPEFLLATSGRPDRITSLYIPHIYQYIRYMVGRLLRMLHSAVKYVRSTGSSTHKGIGGGFG